MEQISSADARNDLKTYIKRVAETGEEIAITLGSDSEEIARLATYFPEPPLDYPEPRFMKLEEGRVNWTKLLQALIARKYLGFRFKRTSMDRPVYLFRSPAYKNPFLSDFDAERKKLRQQAHRPINMEDLAEDLQQLEGVVDHLGVCVRAVAQNMKDLAVSSNRGGDQMAVPELGTVPLRNANDLSGGFYED